MGVISKEREDLIHCGRVLLLEVLRLSPDTVRFQIAWHGFISDGYGKRYLLGPMYMQLGNIVGALDSFEWFQQNFPDDVGEPFQYLCWALVLFRMGKLDAAKKKLAQTMLMNLYLVPHLLNIEIPRLEIWHGANMEEPEYIEYLPEEYLDLWDENAIAWATSIYENPKVQQIFEKCTSIRSRLMHERPGPIRSRLVAEERKLEELYFAD